MDSAAIVGVDSEAVVEEEVAKKVVVVVVHVGKEILVLDCPDDGTSKIPAA